MQRTGQQIIGDIMGLIRGTNVPSIISGGVYREGTRPRDSQKEDLVVVFTTSDAEQFQHGVATINIFVPFIPNSLNGVMLENSARCEQLEIALQAAIKSLDASKSNYRFRLRETIHTNRDDELHQSFVVAKIGFYYFD